jgi:hypothetical protein
MNALASCRSRADILVADVTRPLAEWAPALGERLEAL